MTEFPVRKHPRLPRPVYQAGHIFFLTCATYERFPWFERYEELALASVELLESLAVERETDIFAWCIMPDHVHVLERVQKVFSMSNIPGRAAVYPQPIPVVTRNAARDKPEPYVWRRLSSGFLDTL